MGCYTEAASLLLQRVKLLLRKIVHQTYRILQFSLAVDGPFEDWRHQQD
jgi:hypothetical protein